MKPTDPGLQASHDAEIARRTLRALAERRLIPTPQTFAQVFYEMAGQADEARAEIDAYKSIARDLARQGRLSPQEAAQLVESVQRGEWAAVNEATERALARRPGAQGDNWPMLVQALLRQLDASHPNWTRARKLEALMRVTDNALDQPALALERLLRLVESWGAALGQLPVPPLAAVDALPSAGTTAGAKPYEAARLPAEGGLAAQRAASPDLSGRAIDSEASRTMDREASRPIDGEAGRAIDRDAGQPMNREAGLAIDREAAERERVLAGLRRLVGALCDHLQAMAPDSAWMQGHLEPIRALIAGPMRSAQIDEVEARLASLIAQHRGVRQGLQEAQFALREMLATLIDRIGAMSTSTERFHGKVGGYEAELAGAPDYQTLTRVVRGLLSDTQVVRQEIEKSRTELSETRRRVETYEARVRSLENELTQAVTLVQKDPLTHALNRRGLEQAFEVEVSRAQRYLAPLTLAMIDLDDFKALNDSLGHVAGDRALVHFVTTVQSTLRPTEQAARTGGEEFAILFPATSAAEAAAAVERLQRELARRPFRFEGQVRTLSFSAGVAEWRDTQTLEQLSQNADRALYRAKREGKNRVQLSV